MTPLRRVVTSPWVPAAAVFAACSVALPHPIAKLTTKQFSGTESTRMLIAVKVGADGLGFEGWAVPTTLETDAYLGSADTPGTPEHPEFPLSVHFIRVETAGVLMETVKRDDDVTLTSRYLVQGRRIVPVSQMSDGLVDKLLACLVGLVAAIVCKLLITRHRFTRDRRAR